jgi:hypothetical protein
MHLFWRPFHWGNTRLCVILLKFGVEHVFIYGCKTHSVGWLDAVRGRLFRTIEVPQHKEFELFMNGVEWNKAF